MPPEARHWDLIKAKLRPSPGEVGVEYRTGSVCKERAGGGEQGGNRGAGLEKKKAKRGKGVGRSCHTSLQAVTRE